ncbi:hypothetical protein NC651_012059 [Populus alba x Populus x berolinensis]|nr:hypothetical protein NC651_012059 [Populus alba x Populus x berolinensis]
MGGLTIPCKEDAFVDLTSRLHESCAKSKELREVVTNFDRAFSF